MANSNSLVRQLVRILVERTLSVGNNTNSNEDNSALFDEEYPNQLMDMEKHREYLWLLVFDLLIFMGLTFSSFSSSKKLSKGASTTADDFKPKFIKGLLYANGIRAISLVFIIVLENKSGNDPASWLNYLAHVVPAFVFVSAYMYLVTFLADLYYSNIEYNNHLAKPALLLVVVSAYIILAFMSLITFAAQAFKSFAYTSEFLMAVVYLILGSMIIYYGEKISELFTQKASRSFDPGNDIGKKLRILSLSIGVLFLLKSLCGLLTSLQYFDDLYPVSIGANVWDFFWFLVTEIAPTAVFIFIARKKESATPRGLSPNDFEMNEAPSNDNYIPPINTRK